MPVDVSPYGSMILQMCPLPAQAVGPLADTFGDVVASNVYLTGEQRIELLSSRRLPATAAHTVVNYPFTPDQVRRVVALEKRRGPLLTLARAVGHDGQLAMLQHRNRAAAELASGFLATEQRVDAAELVGFFDVITPAAVLRALPYASPDLLDDATVADIVAGIDVDSVDPAELWQAEFCLGSLVASRPGLVAELRRHGFPELSRPAVVMSPWVTTSDIGTLTEIRHVGSLRARIDACLAVNPWLSHNGAAPRLSGPIGELDDGDVFAALEFARNAFDGGASMGVHMSPVAALNPRLSPRTVDRVARRIRHLSNGEWQFPAWILDPVEELFAERYPDISLRYPPTAETPDSGNRDWEPTRSPVVDADELHELRLSSMLGRKPRDFAVRGAFAAMLGTDPDAWVTAVILASQQPRLHDDEVEVMSAADIAAIASVTSEANAAA